jgi:hypothetical protein
VFPRRYWPGSYWPASYWPSVVAAASATLDIEELVYARVTQSPDWLAIPGLRLRTGVPQLANYPVASYRLLEDRPVKYLGVPSPDEDVYSRVEFRVLARTRGQALAVRDALRSAFRPPWGLVTVGTRSRRLVAAGPVGTFGDGGLDDDGGDERVAELVTDFYLKHRPY